VLAETPTDSQDLRARYIASLDTMHEASDRLVAALQETSAACGVARDLVEGGRPIVEFEQLMEPLPLRTSLSEALAELERTRHAAQRYLFLLLQAEGKTLADIGRTYGISRQLVSRLVNEPDPSHAA
jgi:DNA-directed RNA polymerase sigma subunit (sigma70/sigma32)